MDPKTAEMFYSNHRWLSTFLDDLHSLLWEHINRALVDELGYDSNETWSGYPHKKLRPTVPDYYWIGFLGNNRPGVQITALLGQNYDNRSVPVDEPMLMVVAHDFERTDFGISQDILDNGAIFKPGSDGTSFGGTLARDRTVNFRGFFVPIDAFSAQHCPDVDAAVRSRIVEPLRATMEELGGTPKKRV